VTEPASPDRPSPLPDRPSPPAGPAPSGPAADFPAPAGPPSPAGDEAPAVTHGFLFADLRDYTGYVEAHGDRAGAALLERYRALVREAVAAARGAEIKTEGDSFYVVFGSVSAAVRCGLAIIEAAAATAADPDPIRVGVGVHAGETVETAGGFVGSAVNIASRLCAQARAGELVVSETVRGLTRTQVEVDFQPLGSRHLKGVEEPVACYRVVARGAAAGRGSRPRPSAAGRRSWLLAAGLGIAVLIAVIAGASLLGGGQAAPTPGPSAAAVASAPVSSSPSTAAPTAAPVLGPFPNESEAAILAALPSALAETCVRGGTLDDARLAGFAGTIRAYAPAYPSGAEPVIPVAPEASRGGVTCKPATGADRLYVMAPVLRGVGDAGEYIGYLSSRRQLIGGSCATGDQAHERWTGPSGKGSLACMNPYDGRPWIYFSFAGGKYLAFATRDDSDYDALYAWWDQLKTFLP
jgi:class 3 adenylate cyclase